MNSHNDVLKALSTELQYLRTALNEVGAYIYTKDLNCCYTYANSLVLDLFKASLEEVVGKDDSHFFDLDVCNELHTNDRRVLDHGETIETEEQNIVKSSGEIRIYWTVKKPVYDDNQKIIGICGISTDITERKALEKKIQEQKELLDTILNNVDAHIYVKDSERTFRYVNKKTANLFGLPAEAIIGKKDSDIMPSKIADHFWQIDKKVFDSNSKQTGEEHFVDSEGFLHHYWSIKVPIKLEKETQTLIGFSTDITELHNLKEELQQQAIIDSLTSLYNRRYFFSQAKQEFLRSRRLSTPLSLLLIDIDHFKNINDQYGHPIGDEVLAFIAANCSSLIREEETLARVGGEEFAVLLPNTPIENARQIAERIRQFQAEQKLTGKWDGEIKATVSIGLTTINDQDSDFNKLYERADKALYEAKHQGRNCVFSKD